MTNSGRMEHSSESALRAASSLRSGGNTTPHNQSEWHDVMEQLSEYRYWQLRAVIGRIQSERGVIALGRVPNPS